MYVDSSSTSLQTAAAFYFHQAVNIVEHALL